MPENKNKTTQTKTNEDKKIKDLENTVKQLEEIILKMQSNNMTVVPEKEEVELDINPNKKTKITSLTYGYFTLYAPNRGFLKFQNYGSSHTITYAQLVDYVNACRTSAENGNFYIHNQDMVQDLGLGEIYDNLLSDKIIDKLIFTNELDTNNILSNATDTQKQMICSLVCEKVYNKELDSMAKVEEISRAINVDIMTKLKEMKDSSTFLKQD
jgi:hypothetical protein